MLAGSVTITACGNAGKWKKSLDLLDVVRQKWMVRCATVFFLIRQTHSFNLLADARERDENQSLCLQFCNNCACKSGQAVRQETQQAEGTGRETFTSRNFPSRPNEEKWRAPGWMELFFFH